MRLTSSLLRATHLPAHVKVFDWRVEGARLAPLFSAWSRTSNAAGGDFDHVVWLAPSGNGDAPFELSFELCEGTPLRLLVIASEGATGTGLVEITGAGECVETIVVGPGARLEFVHLVSTSPRATLRQTSRVFKDGFLRNANAFFGQGLTEAFFENRLEEEGSEIRHVDVSLLGKDDRLKEQLLQAHIVGNSKSRSVQKSVLLANASGEFDGMIKVLPNAQKSDALLEAHSMLLSEEARSRMIPGLEIEANDVKCTHSATSAQLTAEKMFYVRSRGLSLSDARAMIVQSFLESAALSFHISARARIDEKIGAKWAREDTAHV